MTWRQLLLDARGELARAGVPEAAQDAWELLSYVSGMDRNACLLHMDDGADAGAGERLAVCVKQRAQRIPLQQITRTAWFYGRPFYVDERVLTPRFDTEVLVAEALTYVEPGMRILDLCTGSGCILLSLLAERSAYGLCGVGADLSADALAVAAVNQERCGARAEWIQSDLFGAVTGEFGLIVSNPPYIAEGVIDTLMPEVRLHEPRMALSGGEDGLSFYRRIARRAGDFLVRGGRLCLEIGYDQGAAVAALLRENGFLLVTVKKDLAGLDRVVTAQWPGAGDSRAHGRPGQILQGEKRDV